MKLSLGARSAILFALFIIVGYVGPWWAVAAPALIVGLIPSERKGWRFYVVVGLLAGAAWITPALIQDLSVGGRISARIAGVIGLPGGIFAYAITACLGALTATLGSSIGASLFEVLQPLLKQRSADKPKD